MSSDSPLPPKRDIALALIEGPSVFVHLDPRREGVVVPTWFKSQSQLVLQIGMNMAVAIPDLEIGEDGISCTLSFNRTPHWCFLPWLAIYGLVCEDGRGMIWPDDVPSELAEERRRPSLKVVEGKRERGSKPATETSKPGKTRLSAVPPPMDEDDEVAEQTTGNSQPPSSLKAVQAPAESAAEESSQEEEPSPPSDDDPNGERKSKRPSYLRVVK